MIYVAELVSETVIVDAFHHTLRSVVKPTMKSTVLAAIRRVRLTLTARLFPGL